MTLSMMHLLIITPFKQPSFDSREPLSVSTAAAALPGCAGRSCRYRYSYCSDYARLESAVPLLDITATGVQEYSSFTTMLNKHNHTRSHYM